MGAAGTKAAAGDRNSRLAALLARVALADQRAFEELYRQTGAHLYGVVLRIVRDRSIAEEILQEAYVKVWHHSRR
jgi:RNA polymerase sigma-70 factor (ECF subfamily)